MTKNFDQWNKIKKTIHDSGEYKLYHVREIWWCSFGVNIGFEQDGSPDEYRRPVLILKGLSKQICFVIPLTTATQDHPLRPSIGLVEGKAARALLSQMRTIDNKRLVRKIGYLNKDIFQRIQKAAKELL
ncbi:MAG: type II toxin-antitoxin system PemK/MazF family toxin [bacterium]|nr:type II toxin-antitoxin system PemK/MazF family toxin [bacterium]